MGSISAVRIPVLGIPARAIHIAQVKAKEMTQSLTNSKNMIS
jgi:hypothetical protein